jgi:hypothetical protein
MRSVGVTSFYLKQSALEFDRFIDASVIVRGLELERSGGGRRVLQKSRQSADERSEPWLLVLLQYDEGEESYAVQLGAGVLVRWLGDGLARKRTITKIL